MLLRALADEVDEDDGGSAKSLDHGALLLVSICYNGCDVKLGGGPSLRYIERINLMPTILASSSSSTGETIAPVPYSGGNSRIVDGRAIRILARSLVRDLVARGLDERAVIALAAEIIGEVAERKARSRRQHGRDRGV